MVNFLDLSSLAAKAGEFLPSTSLVKIQDEKFEHHKTKKEVIVSFKIKNFGKQITTLYGAGVGIAKDKLIVEGDFDFKLQPGRTRIFRFGFTLSDESNELLRRSRKVRLLVRHTFNDELYTKYHSR